MLNLFITDKAALESLRVEYENYCSLCRPLMKIYSESDEKKLQARVDSLVSMGGFTKHLLGSTQLYMEEDTRVIVVKSDPPYTVFDLSEKNMVSAFWHYLKNYCDLSF